MNKQLLKMKKNIVIIVLFLSFLNLNQLAGYNKNPHSHSKAAGFPDITYNNPHIVNQDSIPKSFDTEEPDTSLYMINYGADVLWQYNLGTVVTASPLVKSNKVYIATKDGNVLCLDMDGKLLWQTYISGTIQSQPVIADNIIAIGSMEGDITTLNANTGKLIQTIGLGEPITAPLISFEYQGDRSIIIDNDMLASSIIIGSESGKVYCYDISSLGFLWESDKAKGTIISKPLYSDNKIVYMSNDGHTYCVDSRSGALIWKWSDSKKTFRPNPRNSIISDGKNIFISSTENSVHAIDILLGKSNWSKTTLSGFLTIALSGDSSKIYATSSNNKFYSISARDGKIIKEIEPMFVINTSTFKPVEVNDGIILESDDNNIFLLNKEYDQKAVIFLGRNGIESILNKGKTVIVVTTTGKMFAFELVNFEQ